MTLVPPSPVTRHLAEPRGARPGRPTASLGSGADPQAAREQGASGRVDLELAAETETTTRPGRTEDDEGGERRGPDGERRSGPAKGRAFIAGAEAVAAVGALSFAEMAWRGGGNRRKVELVGSRWGWIRSGVGRSRPAAALPSPSRVGDGQGNFQLGYSGQENFQICSFLLLKKCVRVRKMLLLPKKKRNKNATFIGATGNENIHNLLLITLAPT